MTRQAIYLQKGTSAQVFRALVAFLFVFGLLLHSAPRIEAGHKGEIVLAAEKPSLHILPQTEIALRNKDLRLEPKPDNTPPAISAEIARVVRPERLCLSQTVAGDTCAIFRHHLRPLSRAPPAIA
ncbi:hypothetical protein C9E81_05795 [Paracoccus alkanivorans]|uniref:Uncharacterized protein n=1 Tax=Paracoccus alkanivorans TaxID=2116655 RepID=A0A3M0MEV5_9RHOB|nr:hypothetical protein C9E81_05795 [Paracoccus alkanivorans]